MYYHTLIKGMLTVIKGMLTDYVKVFLIQQEADNDPTGEAAVKTQQMLTYYELDLGLNHVVRKYSEYLEEHANFLITGEFRFCKVVTIIVSTAAVCREISPLPL